MRPFAIGLTAALAVAVLVPAAVISAPKEEKGKPAADLIPDFFAQAVQKLPIPKRMRWGKRKVQFVRPAHWLVALFGDEVVPFELLDLQAGRTSYGHRFHAPGAIELATASEYAERMEKDGHVIADFAQIAQWDPSVVSCTPADSSETGVGKRYTVLI